MPSSPRRVALTGSVLLIAAFLSGPLVAPGVAQDDQPEWADDVFDRLERAVEGYNAGLGPERRGVLERWLLAEARVNLYVEGPDGGEVVASFRTDDSLRITHLQRGRLGNPTLRVRASRAAVERVAGADDPARAVDNEILNGRIRIKRVFRLLPGVVIAVGVREAGLATGGVLLATAAVAKLGVKGLLSALWAGVQKLLSGVLAAGRTLWESLGSIATMLTVLDQLGLLERLKATAGEVYERLRAVVLGVRSRVRGTSPPATDGDDGRDT